MELLPQDIRRTLPPLYATENDEDPIARVKFFAPWNQWTWYVTEFDGDDLFFGLVYGFEIELGYFSLAEMRDVRGPVGLKLERDILFAPTPLSAVREYHRRLERGE